MMGIAAQVSLYPLRQDHLSPAIGEVVKALQEHGLETQMGSMFHLPRPHQSPVNSFRQSSPRALSSRGGKGCFYGLTARRCPG